MKIYSASHFQMTDIIGEYIPVSEVSYEYEGPIALSKGATDEEKATAAT